MTSTTTKTGPASEIPAANSDVSEFRGQPAVRQRVADHVFESLVKGILAGELKPESQLPTQRELAQQFNVSALVVRQAVHRLEDLGLVRVRQGSPTIVLDPEESTDIRLIQLQMQLSETGSELSRAAIENQLLFVLPLLTLAERRITEQEIVVLNHMIDSAGGDATSVDVSNFRVAFWRQIARATRNRLFQQQVRWWTSFVSRVESPGASRLNQISKLEQELYRRMTAALAAKQGTVAIYLAGIKPLLDIFDARRAKVGPSVPPGA
jgi:DNA-binding FadR family transcriptional regulator